MPNTLYASADCKQSGDACLFCYLQAFNADGNKLSLQQQKAFISWTNAEFCGMSSRAEHA